MLAQANAPDHPIHNSLMRITADNPELLAMIKEKGRRYDRPRKRIARSRLE